MEDVTFNFDRLGRGTSGGSAQVVNAEEVSVRFPSSVEGQMQCAWVLESGGS